MDYDDPKSIGAMLCPGAQAKTKHIRHGWEGLWRGSEAVFSCPGHGTVNAPCMELTWTGLEHEPHEWAVLSTTDNPDETISYWCDGKHARLLNHWSHWTTEPLPYACL